MNVNPLPPQSYQMDPLQADEGMSIDPREILRIFQRRWKLIAGIVAIGLGITLTYLLLATPLYTAATEILLDLRKDQVVDTEAIISGIGSDAGAFASEIKLMSSSAVGERVIKKLKLYNDPEYTVTKSGGVFGALQSLLGGGGASEDADAARFENTAKPELTEEQMGRLTRAFLSRIKVKRLGRTYIVSVSYTSSNPNSAARVTNEIADAYLVDQLEAKYQATRRANTWLQGRLGELQTKVQETERAVELYRAENNLVGPKGQSPYDAQLTKLNEQLILGRVRMNENLDKLKQARQVLEAKGKLSTIDAVAQSDVVSKLRGQLAVVAQQEAELITRFTPAHPKVINKRGERKDLEHQIEREAKRIIENLENDYKFSRRRVASLEQSLTQLKQKTSGARSASIRLRELEREANANRTIYEAFLGRFKETSQQETLRTANSRVIAKALPPTFASHPKKKRTLLLALIGFSALGFGLAYLLEQMDSSFKTSSQIEEILNVAHLTSIPKLLAADLHIDGNKVPINRYIMAKPLSSYAESIRTLKVGIELSNIDRPPQVILITSALPNEGKSAIASNLAQHAAQVGARTLLIDGDLRNPSLTANWIIEPGHGLVDLLGNRVNKEQAIVRDNSGVDFLQTSHVAQNSAEILGSTSFKKMLMDLRQIYNVIIIDTSPVMPVIDAKVLVDSVDSIVLTVKWDETARDIVRDAIKSLNAPPEKFAGVVLNAMDMKRMSHYGSYGYGKYYSKYPHYYGSTES